MYAPVGPDTCSRAASAEQKEAITHTLKRSMEACYFVSDVTSCRTLVVQAERLESFDKNPSPHLSPLPCCY